MLHRSIVVVMTTWLLAGCASRKPVVTPSLLTSLDEAVVARAVAGSEEGFEALGAATRFPTSAKEVVCWVRLRALTRLHVLRWRWYAPDGSLYYDTGDYFIQPTGAYHTKVTTWHRLPVAGTAASDLPGPWRVVVEMDEELLAEIDFTITPAPKLKIGGT